MTKKPALEMDPEIIAINDVYAALKDLDPEAQARVLGYVAGKLKISALASEPQFDTRGRQSDDTGQNYRNEGASDIGNQDHDDLDGVSPVARKWMTRNGLQSKQLSEVFSLGVDEIDLVAKTVPGKNKKERMHSVFLLKGVAAYLGTGAARFSHEQMKEACLHYDAFDAANFALNFKSLSSEVSGNKDAGYSLTARGLANATEMVKTITAGSPG
jgi:hypothetical protein